MVRNIVIAYLSEQGYLAKKEITTMTEKGQKKNEAKELAEELDTFDIMLYSLVELLEEKGIVTQKEWEHRIKRKSLRARGIKSYRDKEYSE